MDHCLCLIVKGEATAHVVYEDDMTPAFYWAAIDPASIL